jgi:hypothetical protein
LEPARFDAVARFDVPARSLTPALFPARERSLTPASLRPRSLSGLREPPPFRFELLSKRL